MFANPKETMSLRFDATIKKLSMEILAQHGMSLTQALEEYLDELVYQWAALSSTFRPWLTFTTTRSSPTRYPGPRT